MYAEFSPSPERQIVNSSKEPQPKRQKTQSAKHAKKSPKQSALTQIGGEAEDNFELPRMGDYDANNADISGQSDEEDTGAAVKAADDGINERLLSGAIASCSAEEQASWFNARFAAHMGPKLSVLEHQQLEAACFIRVNDDGSPHALDKLASHLKKLCPKWEKVLQGHVGSPAMLIVSGSAKRCVDIIRGLGDMARACKVVKLFAKHLKVEEQVELLKQSVCIGVGTPNRLAKLADTSALSFGKLKFVILDMHVDAKQFVFLDYPEVRSDFWDFYHRHLQGLTVDKQTRVIMY
eukprot:jgi/Chlat1/5773/Chrsp387S00876